MEETMAKQARPKPGVREQWAVRAVFFLGGFGTASWAPLVPYLKIRLGLAEDVLGLLLLCGGIGSLVTMPLSTAVPAVSTLGNLGVLMDPVAIGFLAHAVGLEDAFFFLAMLVVLEMAIAGYVYRTMKV